MRPGITIINKILRRRTAPDALSPAKLGQWGEEMARHHLEDLGFRTVATGFRARIGYRQDGAPLFGEIDIIAWDYSASPATLVFIEVKTRRDDAAALPEAAVDRRKRRRIRRTSRIFRQIMHLTTEPVRFDVVSIVTPAAGRPRISLLRNLFTDE